MKVLYIHGLGGSKQSSTGLVIASKFDTYLDNFPLLDFDAMKKKLELIASLNKFDLVVGNSLGGYWANYFSNTYRVPAILINPCFDPLYLINEVNKATFGRVVPDEFANYKFHIDKVEHTLILSKDDEFFGQHFHKIQNPFRTHITEGTHQNLDMSALLRAFKTI